MFEEPKEEHGPGRLHRYGRLFHIRMGRSQCEKDNGMCTSIFSLVTECLDLTDR